MLKIWYAKVRKVSTAHATQDQAQKWCEENVSSEGAWHVGKSCMEMRANNSGFWLADMMELEVQGLVEAPKNVENGNLVRFSIKLPPEKLEKDMTCSFKGNGNAKITWVGEVQGQGFRIITNLAQFQYASYEYSLLTLADAIRLEDDPLRKLAWMILAGDAQALDAARDTLKC